VPTPAPSGLYVLGVVNTASCPALAYYIGSEAACRAAGAALNLAWGSAVNLATVPRWCSATTTNVYFNAHPIGAGFITAQPLCLTSGTPAPTDVGDTHPPTLSPAFELTVAPTLSPTFPGGEPCAFDAAEHSPSGTVDTRACWASGLVCCAVVLRLCRLLCRATFSPISGALVLLAKVAVRYCLTCTQRLERHPAAQRGTPRRWRAVDSARLLSGYRSGTRVLGCCGKVEGPHARAVLSCAGAYVSGAVGSNECPAGSVRIATEAACRAAAAAAGKTADSPFGRFYATEPRGCIYYNTSGDYAYFNTHAVGAGSSYSQLLCAAVTTGAPSHCTDARVCGRVRVGTAHVNHARTCTIVRALSGVHCGGTSGQAHSADCVARQRRWGGVVWELPVGVCASNRYHRVL
jgi:hypothetical protein